MEDSNIYITIDLDWAPDQAIEYTLDMLEKANANATFFVTHQTPLLERIRKNPNMELGIHPNFNELLQGTLEDNTKNIYSIIEDLLELVPEAKSVRSHSLAGGSIFCDAFERFGLRYDCNLFVPVSTGIPLKPWAFRNAIIMVPFMWSDYLHCSYKWDWDVDKYLNVEGLKVFAFHPIHIVLNTLSLDSYDRKKTKVHSVSNIMELRERGNKYGTDMFLQSLLSKAHQRDIQTKNVNDISIK